MTATHEAFITQLSVYRTHTTLGTKKADALSAKLSDIRLQLTEQTQHKSAASDKGKAKKVHESGPCQQENTP